MEKLADGIHRFTKDKWTRGHFHEYSEGVVGWLFKHLYSVPWNSDLTMLKLVEGEVLPDRPATGYGSAATITRVERGVKDGTSREVIVVHGFEAKPWE